jgi:hypothetical protein
MRSMPMFLNPPRAALAGGALAAALVFSAEAADAAPFGIVPARMPEVVLIDFGSFRYQGQRRTFRTHLLVQEGSRAAVARVEHVINVDCTTGASSAFQWRTYSAAGPVQDASRGPVVSVASAYKSPVAAAMVVRAACNQPTAVMIRPRRLDEAVAFARQSARRFEENAARPDRPALPRERQSRATRAALQAFTEGCALHLGDLAGAVAALNAQGLRPPPPAFSPPFSRAPNDTLLLRPEPDLGIAAVVAPDALTCRVYLQQGELAVLRSDFIRVVEGIARPGVVVAKVSETTTGPVANLAYRVSVPAQTGAGADRLFSLTTNTAPASGVGAILTVAAVR